MNGDRLDRQMRAEAFAAFVLRQMEAKGREYAVDGDPNGNFKRLAAKTGNQVQKVWFAHFSKHMDAIENWIKDPSRSMVEPIEGRIQDAIAYLLILQTLRQEGVIVGDNISRYGGGDGGE